MGITEHAQMVLRLQILSFSRCRQNHKAPNLVTSYVLSVHQPCPEHQDVGSCDPPGRSLQHPAVCRSTEGCACPRTCEQTVPVACRGAGAVSPKSAVWRVWPWLLLAVLSCLVLPLRPALEAGPAYLQQHHPKKGKQKTTFFPNSFFPWLCPGENMCGPSFLGKQGMPKPQPQPPSRSPLSPLPSRFDGAAALREALSSRQPCAAGSWAQLMPPQEGNALASARYQRALGAHPELPRCRQPGLSVLQLAATR